MAPSPQSRFIEGSMNDRTSNAPPPGYLGSDAEGTDEYERQFALDWRAPGPNSPRSGNRSSVVSINSAASPTSPRSVNPTSPRSVNTWSKGHKPAGSTTSGFLAPLWGGVKERLSLTRSKSSNTITSEKHSSSDDGGSSIFILPTFKHKRSESTNTAQVLRSNNNSSRQLDTKSLHHGSEKPTLKKAPSAATLPIGGVNAPHRFDPATRPTREEIQANYQSLLASGFFGNRAIQSTRFSAPGQNQNRPNQPPSPSFAHRISEDGYEQQRDESSSPPPPPPQRQPPPPPPTRTAPKPPDLTISTEVTSSSSSSVGIPASETVVWSPVPSESQATWDVPPPPPPPSPPKHKKPSHRPSLSLSSVFSSARSSHEPSESRPFRLPPSAHAKYSLDSGRRSSDGQRNMGPNHRGVKRPFTAAHGSDLSLAGRVYYGIIGGVESDTGVTAAEESRQGQGQGQESGARKLVKKLRKSASRLSMDLGKTMSRPGSVFGYESDSNNSGLLSPTREPLSAVFKRSFSWRVGKGGPEDTTSESKGTHERNSSNNNRGGNETPTGNGPIGAAPRTTTSGRFLPPSLSIITGSPSSPERNKLKKKEIYGRRLRRQDSNLSPSKDTYQAPETTPIKDRDTTMEYTMDWQSSHGRPSHPAGNNNNRQSRSRSRSRPRRSPTAIFMHNQSRPGTAHSTDSYVSTTSNQNYKHQVVVPVSFSSPLQPRRSAEVTNATPNGTDRMEGVEFAMPSFHFPSRVRPGAPLAVVPDTNRGIPSVPSIPGEYREPKMVNGRGENSSMDAMAI